MLQFLPCAKCQKTVALKMPVALESRVTCPHCREEYVLGEYIEQELGYWEVRPSSAVLSSGPPEPDKPTLEMADEDELQLAPESNSIQKKPAVASGVRPLTHDDYERIKKKNRTPFWQIVQVALGGLAAIPLALLIMWHFLDRDILEAGPTVAKYAPWLVPKKFHPPEEEDAEQPARNPPASGESGFRQFDDVIGNRPTFEASSEDAPTIGGPSAEAPSSGGTTSGPSSMELVDPEGAGSQGDQESDAQDWSFPSTERHLNLLQRIRACSQSFVKWNQAVAEEADLREPAQQVYSSLTALAEPLESLPPHERVLQAVRDRMQPIGGRVLRDQDLQDVIAQGARYWHEQHSDDAKFSLAIVLEIADAREDSGSWQIASDDASELGLDSVLVPTRLAPALIPGKRVLLIGQVHRHALQTPDSEDDAAGEDKPSAPKKTSFLAYYIHGL